MNNSNTFSRDVRAAKSNKGETRPKDKIIGNSSTEDWLDAFDTDEERSREGYKDTSRFRNEPYNNIYTPNGMIDMSETGIPLMANGQYLPPYSGIHNMGTPYVREERIAKYGGIPRAQDGWFNNAAMLAKLNEPAVNKALGEPMAKAEEAAAGKKWFNPKTKQWEQQDDIDNFRHPMAGRYTAEAIANKFPSWMQYTGIPQAAGFVGANALGIGHEITNPRTDPGYTKWDTWREGLEDAFNNGVGATVGSLPIAGNKKTAVLKYLSDNNKLPDGQAKYNMYFKKENGGPLKKYQGDEGGSQVSYLNAPIYKDFNDYYERNKDATTYVNKKVTKLYPDPALLAGEENGIDKPARLLYTFQENDPDTKCTKEGCTARANRPIAASFFGKGNTWFENPDVSKKALGADYSTSNKPTAEDLKKYPYMTSDEKFGSMDAWDILDQAHQKIPKNVIYSNLKRVKDYDNDYSKTLDAFKTTSAPVKDIWKKYDIPVGSYINLGTSGNPEYLPGHGRKDLVAGSHTVRVVGYAEDGEPLIADYGEIRKLSENKFYDNVAGVVSVPGKEKYTYKYFKDQQALEKKGNKNPYITDIDSEKYGDDYKKFHNNIVKEKNYIAAQLGVSPEKYDQYAKIALTLGGAETEFGKGTMYNIPFLDKMGESTGVAQVTESNVADKYKKTLAKYKDDSEAYNAMATLLYVKELDAYKDKWMKSGKKAGERPFVRSSGDVEEQVKNDVRSIQGRKPQGYINSPDSGDIFRYTDANNKPREIELPYKQIWQSDADYEKEVNDMLKKTDPTLRFSAKGTKGERTIYKKTKGNTIPENLEDFVYYAWQAPNAVVYGDAQGNSGYYKKAKAIEQNLFGQKLAKKEMGGESGWLDEYDLPKGQNGLLAVPTYYGGKEQNMSQYPMTTAQKLIYKSKAAAEAQRQYNTAKVLSNVASFIPGPVGYATSGLSGGMDISEGNALSGASQFIPTKASLALSGLNNLMSAKDIYNYGVTPEPTYPDMLPYYTDEYKRELFKPQSLTSHKHGGINHYKNLPHGTTKNIVRGINKLFVPDPKLFGPFGRHTFDPNSKFEDGGWLDNHDLPKAQMYNSQVGVGRLGDLRSAQDNTRVFVPNLPKKPLTKAEQQEAKWYDVRQASRDLEKANEKLAKIRRIRASDKAQKEQGWPTTRQEWADQTQAIGDKLSLQNIPVIGDYIPDLLDVTGGIGHMSSALGSAPLRAQQEDSYKPYLNAIGFPLLQGALAGIGTKTTGEFVNNVMNPFAGMSLKGLRRKPAQNIEFDPNHYEFSNPEMTDYFAQQPKGEAAYYDELLNKKAAEKEQWQQELEQTRQDALNSQPEGGIELFGENDDPFGNYQNAVNANTPANVPNPAQGIREQAMANLVQRDMPNIQPLNITPPSSIPPPPTYEQYLNGSSSIGTTPLSREHYNYIINTPTPSLQSTPPTTQGWMGMQEPDWIRNAPGLFDTQTSPRGGYQSGSYVGTTPNVQPTPRIIGQIDLSNIRNTTRTAAPAPKSDWDDITENLKQNKKSTEAVDVVKKELAKDKNVTGRVEYNDVASSAKHTLLDKSAIPSSDKIDGLINNFEEVLSHTPQDHKLRNKLVAQVEDLKSTKWLREEYTKELEAQGLKPQKDLSIVTSNSNGYLLKHLVDKDGNIIASIDISPEGYVGSSGLAHKYHGANLKRLNFENEAAAQTALEERLKTRNLEALQNSFDRGYLDFSTFDSYIPGIERSAQEEAAKTMERVLRNNNNKFGEGLYRAVHHGIKDTRGGLKSNKHFVETNLENPITGVPERAYRGRLGWQSWAGHSNPKAVDEFDAFGMPQFRMIRKYGGWLEDYE